MSRGLDHIVHAVRDLDAAGEAYARLGFTVGARNRHPWGTHNRIVQLPGFFIELLTVAEPDKVAPATPRRLSFGAFNEEFLTRGEGFSMLVLESRDAAADTASFHAAGIGDFETFCFEREGKRPDGSPVKVAFSLAFAADPRAPGIGFFTCQQHFPESFWSAAFQSHASSVSGVAGVVLVAENPSDHHIFLSAFSGVRDMYSTSSGITIATPRGDIRVMDRAAFALRYGTEPPDIARGARLAALRFAVRDRGAVEAVLAKAGIVPLERMGSLIVGPEIALGATIVFEPA